MRTLFLISLLFLMSCHESRDPQSIVDKAIEKVGGEKFLHCEIAFDFRDRHYAYRRMGGEFEYQRIFKDSTQTLHDFYNNDGFYRLRNGEKVEVPDSMAVKYIRSINSVWYFALLPFGLNDHAVNKKFIGETTIGDEPYYKIEVTFEQEGGGEDYQDIFHYWIHKEKFSIDYFSYLYFSEGGGIRFREAYQHQTNMGITLQNYVNYKPESDSVNRVQFDLLENLFKSRKLKKLSEIELRNIEVKILPG